ncbi:MAG: hypothetical protein GC182_03435 [Rhodopseudomonas sp.]|nr:hypothetical protein [Rhodopseudomonas sp.]
MNCLRLFKAALLTLMLAGCAGGPQLLSDAPKATSDATDAEPAGASAIATAQNANMQTAAVQTVALQNGDMPGRWILAAPHAPTCGMMFAALPGAPSGTIVPEGGCPERFYTSSQWTLHQNVLTIADSKSRTLATLTLTGGKFAGNSESNTPVTLSR